MLRNPWNGARAWSPWRELERMRGELDRLFEQGPEAAFAGETPRIDVWAGENGLKLVAQIPGLDAGDLDLSVVGDTLTLKGGTQDTELPEDATVHRRERPTGRFARTLQLPYEIESDEVQARLENGLLEVDLPRAKAQRPRKIAIGS
jgi:HSP20 family protein